MDCLDENTVAAFVEQLLPPDALERIDDHVDRCAACRRLLSNVAGVLNSRPGMPLGDARREHAPRTESLATGSIVGRYVVLSRLATGAMGVVYAAFDPKLNRKVALKLVRLSSDDDGSGEARHLREAQAMARMSHPNVVRVYDVG